MVDDVVERTPLVLFSLSFEGQPVRFAVAPTELDPDLAEGDSLTLVGAVLHLREKIEAEARRVYWLDFHQGDGSPERPILLRFDPADDPRGVRHAAPRHDHQPKA